MFKSTIALAAFVATTLAAPYAPHTIHETGSPLSSAYSTTKAHPNITVPVRIGLAQEGSDVSHNTLVDISNSSSPNYGKHLSKEEVEALFQPRNETIHSVLDWLSHNNIGPERASLSPARNWIHFNASIGELESLLHTDYQLYQYDDGSVHIGTDQYSLPESLTQHIDLIIPTVPHIKPSRKGHQAPPPVSANGTSSARSLKPRDMIQMTQDSLRRQYGIPPGHWDLTSLGILSLEPQRYNEDDLRAYFKEWTDIKDADRALPILRQMDGSALSPIQSGSSDSREITMDLEIAIGLVYPQKVTNFHTHGGLARLWLDEDNAWEPASVISISYSAREDAVPIPYLERQCTEFKKLALRGSTIVVGSGDWGVEYIDKGCSNGAFVPLFPATCPYVTAVGATQMGPGESVPGSEVAISEHIVSGGGFSNFFDVMEFQKGTVRDYLDNHDNVYSPRIFNRGGRAYPDISVNGAWYLDVRDGQTFLDFGTSASAPAMAAMFTLINNLRLAAGLPTIGWVNPTLYENPWWMKDVTVGNNPGCGTQGFEASQGWDPVTGLGTPYYPGLAQLFGVSAEAPTKRKSKMSAKRSNNASKASFHRVGWALLVVAASFAML